MDKTIISFGQKSTSSIKPMSLVVVLMAATTMLAAGCESKVSNHIVALDSKSILKEQGLAFTYAVPQLASESDTIEHPKRSAYSLTEDGKPLGPAHSTHDEVRKKGNGRWSHWEQAIYFSSSDGTDPRQNNRKYVLKK